MDGCGSRRLLSVPLNGGRFDDRIGPARPYAGSSTLRISGLFDARRSIVHLRVAYADGADLARSADFRLRPYGDAAAYLRGAGNSTLIVVDLQ